MAEGQLGVTLVGNTLSFIESEYRNHHSPMVSFLCAQIVLSLSDTHSLSALICDMLIFIF